jgi:hypothetical protein
MTKPDGRSAKSRRFKELRAQLAAEFSDLKQTASVDAFLDQAASLSVECARLNEAVRAGRTDVGNDLIRATNGLARVLGLLRGQRDRPKPNPSSTAQDRRRPRPSDPLWEGIDTVRYLEESEVFELCRISDRVDDAGSVEALSAEQQVELDELLAKAAIRPQRPSDELWRHVNAYSFRSLLTDSERQEWNQISDLVDNLGATNKLERDQQLRVRAILSRAMLPV